MEPEIRILILEDSVRDVELLERELRRGKIPFRSRKVDTREDFISELEEFNPDLVIADYKLPSFDGMLALELVRARSALLPFILVSGYVGEEQATEALKNGATDFILKDRLGRLVPCVQRALREAADRAEHQRMEARFGRFLESAPNALVMTNAEGVIEMVNGQTARMFGFSQDELVGRRIELLFPERFREYHPGPPLSFFATHAPESPEAPGDLFGRRSDASEFPVEIEINPIETGENPEILYVIVDISTRRRIEHEKDWQRRELEWSNADFEEFALIASHNLKAPLVAIGDLADRIHGDVVATAGSDTVRDVRLLQDRVKRLRTLLDGLLTYSRIGRVQSAQEDVDIPRLVLDIVGGIAPRPGFLINCVGAVTPIRTGIAPIRIVLENLIVNGITHHDRPEGRIRISMRQENGVAEFRVSDDGPGIDPQFHERIFAIFQPLAGDDDVETNGIGLAIVKRQIEGHGGRIWVESAPPARGTTFVFTWMEAP